PMETFTMSRKEAPRAGLLKAALAGKVTNADGAAALHMTVRQFQRLKRRFRDGGLRALVHGLRGRPSNHHPSPNLRDHTSTLLALHFRPAEDLHGYAVVFHQTFTTHGLPLALYGDRLNVLVRNDRHWTLDEELAGVQHPTHLGRVLQELGIGYIQARSPQAKGRVERLWATLQDRLVSELRLRGLTTRAAANAFLPAFIADF